ncbi:hypothetical protein I317_04484 [Kwoniella heveanensis CBS 569]|nr:hypothetical protein I317_04484 [Kwoniella heveanensis CBS 569]
MTFLSEIGQWDENPSGDYTCDFELDGARVHYERKAGTEAVGVTIDTDVTEIAIDDKDAHGSRTRFQVELQNTAWCPVTTLPDGASGTGEAFVQSLSEALDDEDACGVSPTRRQRLCSFDPKYQGLASEVCTALSGFGAIKSAMWEHGDKGKWHWQEDDEKGRTASVPITYNFSREVASSACGESGILPSAAIAEQPAWASSVSSTKGGHAGTSQRTEDSGTTGPSTNTARSQTVTPTTQLLDISFVFSPATSEDGVGACGTGSSRSHSSMIRAC